MAGVGPAPKVTGRRSRVPRERGDWTVLDRPPGPVPGLPPAPRGGWSEFAEGEWVRWWSHPTAAMWDDADYGSVAILLKLVHELWEDGSPTAANAVRVMKDTLGIGAKGRQDRRWLLPEEKALGLAPVEAAKVIPLLAGD